MWTGIECRTDRRFFSCSHFCALERNGFSSAEMSSVHWPSEKPLTSESPHHSRLGSDDPTGVQRWRGTPLRGRGSLILSHKLFYLFALKIASYFPTPFISAPFHLWLWDSGAKGFPRASHLGMWAQGASCIDPPGTLLRYLPVTAARDFSIKFPTLPQSTFDLPSPLPSL